MHGKYVLWVMISECSIDVSWKVNTKQNGVGDFFLTTTIDAAL